LIEKALNRKLVWLPCRHHVMEIILKGVFEIFWNTTSGPNVPIFDRFKNSWGKLDQSKFKSGLADESVSTVLIKKRAEIITFINSCLQVKIVHSLLPMVKTIYSNLQLLVCFRCLNPEMIIKNCYCFH